MGIKNFVFKGENAISMRYNNIESAIMFNNKSSRKDDVFTKADMLLIDKESKTFPLSIKMHNTTITWESADSTFKAALYDFSKCYGKPTLPYGKRIIIPIEGDLTPFVFGDDILDDGCICIQTISDKDFIQYNKDTVVVNMNRVFTNKDEVLSDEYFKPCLSVRQDKNRNINDEIIKGYRVEVSPIGSCVNMMDVLNEISFK